MEKVENLELSYFMGTTPIDTKIHKVDRKMKN